MQHDLVEDEGHARAVRAMLAVARRHGVRLDEVSLSDDLGGRTVESEYTRADLAKISREEAKPAAKGIMERVVRREAEKITRGRGKLSITRVEYGPRPQDTKVILSDGRELDSVESLRPHGVHIDRLCRVTLTAILKETKNA